MTNQCSILDCLNPQQARQMCSKHYQKWQRYGDPLKTVRPRHSHKGCLVSGCELPRRNKGYCAKHVWRLNTTGSPYAPKRIYASDVLAREADFWSAVNTNVDKTLCWEWTRGTTTRGYGAYTYQAYGRTYRTCHQIAYILHYKTPLDGKHVLHTCDNPRCCNPHHLYLGTHKDNMKDKLLRGRTNKGMPRGTRLK